MNDSALIMKAKEQEKAVDGLYVEDEGKRGIRDDF